jgi:hypothetical protein
MTTERTVPEDFPRETRMGSLAGSQPKLLLRKVGDRYAAGLTTDELYERYAAVEKLANELAVYTQRKITSKRWAFDEALRRVELGVENKVHYGTWNISAAEISWLMSRTRQIVTDSATRDAGLNS